tara:strand:- start:592 stop:846 length:255 start_codon:yes stop_codon:yes gene_type:complete
MIKIWFLMALVSYPNMSAIAYKGFGGFLEKEECENNRVMAENQMAAFEIKKGNTVYIETYCMEMNAFKSSLSKKNEKKIIENDA